MIIIAGIDYSMTTPGICIFNQKDGLFTFANAHHYFLSTLVKFDQFKEGNLEGINHKKWESPQERYTNIAEWAMALIRQHKVDRVFIEDYSFGSTGRVFHIAENMAILKDRLWDDFVQFETIPPTVIKKFATGKGNANKDAMYESFCKENLLVDLKGMLTPKADHSISPVSDIVDAYYIAKYGYKEGL